MPGEILFKINRDGNVDIEVNDVEDASCAEITRAFEEALGEVKEVQRKPNYYVELEGIENYQYESEGEE